MGKLYDLLSSLIEKVNSTVKVSAQTLTEEQKTQARANIGAGTSDVKTWSNIEDKPFGDFPTGGDTLTWDGNTEGLETLDLYQDGSGVYVKVSNADISVADLSGGIKFNDYGNNLIPLDNLIDLIGNGAVFTMTPTPFLFFIVTEDTSEDGLTLTKGVYFFAFADGTLACSSLTIPGYTGFPVTKKIEERYLPDRGPIYLYVDAEYYLYATEDTSDINKRVTCQQFESFIDSGRLVVLKYVDSDGGIDCFYPWTLNISSNGVGKFMSPTGANFHTAEYVAE